ncbi:hypothetical protein LPY66_07065 [Dehalobacter sp. DCM]|uniref:hypothetical protein n=1 Tax=Dehalobacter sp. DCM TaxID=2907827 RepID=UPI0030813194|nr:hypothetical protein LPY66_07065 [Dehalobacter sp. DCM]
MSKKLLCLVIMLYLILLMFGRRSESNIPPLPISAKQTVEGQIMIPFPYGDKFPSGDERWFLDRDTSNKFVLRVSFRSQDIGKFPVRNTGLNTLKGEITLGGIEYSVVSIYLNNDELSGYMILHQNDN